MTKKHFVALAASLKAQKPEASAFGDSPALAQWRAIANATADTCAAANPNFNRSRFLAACGVT